MLRRFFKDGAVYALPPLVGKAIALFTLPIYSQLLSPSEFGVVDLCLAFAALANLTVGLEISQGQAREIADHQDAKSRAICFSTALWFSCILHIFFLLLCLSQAGAASLWLFGAVNYEDVFRIACVYVFINSVFYLLRNQLRWDLKSAHYAVSTILNSAITPVVGICLCYYYNFGANGALWGMVAGALVSMVYAAASLRHSFVLAIDTKLLRRMLHFSIPLVPASMAYFLNSYIDRLFIGHYLSLHEVGVFGMAMRVASLVGLVTVGFQGAITPLIYSSYRNPETKDAIASIFRYFVALVLLACLATAVFSNEIFGIITTEAYISAKPVSLVLAPALVLAEMYIFMPGLHLERRTRSILLISSVGAIATACLAWLLIPVLGLMGAAVGTLFANGLVFLLYARSSQRLFYVPHQWRRLALATFCIAAIGGGYLVMQNMMEMSIGLKFGAMALGAVALIFVGLVRWDELQEVRQVIRRRLAL